MKTTPDTPPNTAGWSRDTLRLEYLRSWIEIQRLKEKLGLANHRKFGASSEAAPTAQMALVFDEAELEASPEAPEAPEPRLETIPSYTRVKATRQRTPDLSALPVEEIEYTLPEEERVCPQCSGEMHSIGHEVRQWLDQTARQASPKLLLGSALTYCLNQWPNLCRFLEDGRLEIDNNRSERSIKPFVIGRKNWLFANTPKGATTSAVIYSIVETAKENGLNPAAYLQHLFEQLPNIDIHDPRQLDQLLPWSEVVKERCAAPANKRA